MPRRIGDRKLRLDCGERKEFGDCAMSLALLARQPVLMVAQETPFQANRLAAAEGARVEKIRQLCLGKAAAVLVERAGFTVRDQCSALRHEIADLPRLRWRERSGAGQNKNLVAATQQFALFHLPVRDEIVL